MAAFGKGERTRSGHSGGFEHRRAREASRCDQGRIGEAGGSSRAVIRNETTISLPCIRLLTHAEQSATCMGPLREGLNQYRRKLVLLGEGDIIAAAPRHGVGFFLLSNSRLVQRPCLTLSPSSSKWPPSPIDRELFRLLKFALKIDAERTALVYFSQPNGKQRVQFVTRVLRKIRLRTKEQVEEWKGIAKDFDRLIPTRNAIVHQPLRS